MAKYGRTNNLSRWDVASVQDMVHMFAGAASFNGDLSKWNVSRVTSMVHMFVGAASFAGDLSCWNVRVENMRAMYTLG